MSDHVDRIIDALTGCCSECADRAEHIAYGINEHAPAGLLASPAHDAAVAAKAWDEGFKQGGPMHDVNYDDPDAHTRNPYRIEHEGGAS